jgi:S-adenosylmethionine-diacylgycerolhomoserine-N-methlytransferase
MGLWSDLKVLYEVNCRPIRGRDQAARLECFYARQAHLYDDFRKKFLHGRQELWERLPIPANGIWIDMGAGTGSNLEFLGDKIERLKKIYLVDLTPSLQAIARRRVEQHAWHNVEIVNADAVSYRPPEGLVDLVTFSYSLTMIPDWFAAISHAQSLMQPGGLIGVVDFYVARKHPDHDRVRHAWFTRMFWPMFFARDNVFLSSDHLPYLDRHFDRISLCEQRKRIPYVPLIKVPYFQFLGRKRSDDL